MVFGGILSDLLERGKKLRLLRGDQRDHLGELDIPNQGVVHNRVHSFYDLRIFAKVAVDLHGPAGGLDRELLFNQLQPQQGEVQVGFDALEGILRFADHVDLVFGEEIPSPDVLLRLQRNRRQKNKHCTQSDAGFHSVLTSSAWS
jgi:hypothetical protein